MQSTNYKKIDPSHPSYERVQAMQAAGQWMCDAYYHTESDNCPNPDCFKHEPRNPAWDEFDKMIEDKMKGLYA